MTENGLELGGRWREPWCVVWRLGKGNGARERSLSCVFFFSAMISFLLYHSFFSVLVLMTEMDFGLDGSGGSLLGCVETLRRMNEIKKRNFSLLHFSILFFFFSVILFCFCLGK